VRRPNLFFPFHLPFEQGEGRGTYIIILILSLLFIGNAELHFQQNDLDMTGKVLLSKSVDALRATVDHSPIILHYTWSTVVLSAMDGIQI